MDYNLFHFSTPYWLYGLIIIPILWCLYSYLQPSVSTNTKSLGHFADKHLLPHLLIRENASDASTLQSLALWSAIWCLLMLAMAGPRWSYREFSTYTAEQNMVILLDLSKSMDAQDIKPTRMHRARLEVEEILRLNPNVHIGLIGFAAHAHMISPITEDHENIKRLLPMISPDLITIQGSRLSSALKMAEEMLVSNAGTNSISAGSLIILTDGGFQDNESFSKAQRLAANGVAIHTIGIGTAQGVSFTDNNAKPLMRNGKVAFSRLEEDKLKELSKIGKGRYFSSHYSDRNANAIKQILVSEKSRFHEEEKKTKHWDERFYIFILPILFIIIFWYRRGFIFPFLVAAIFFPASSYAIDRLDNFSSRILLNDQNFAKKLIEENNSPEEALEYLDDPYRRGIAYYRSGNFKQAAEEFKKNTRPEVAKESLYNLGNSLAIQNKIKEATKSYKQAIEMDGDFADAKHNLALVEKILEQQQQQSKENESKDDNKGESKDNTKGNSSNNTSNDSDEESSEDSKDNSSDESEKESEQKENDDRADIDSGDNNEDAQGESESQNEPPQDQSKSQDSSMEGNVDIDEWLDRISDDYTNFLKNQFYIESQREAAKNKLEDNLDPW